MPHHFKAAAWGLALAASGILLPLSLTADDWPMSGRDASRNAVSVEKNPPLHWQVEIKDKNGNIEQPRKNILWQATLGSNSLGGPVVANGLVWVGTNKVRREEPKRNNAAALMCFRESDGKLLYEFQSPRLKEEEFQDWPDGSMPAPLVEGDRLWIVTNRCETLCLDIGPLRRGEGEPKTVWKFDMIKDLGVYPRASGMSLVPPCSIGASHKDLIFVTTGNGRSFDAEKLRAPDAPSLVCFNKHSGKVVWKDNSPGENIIAGQFSNPLLIEVNGKAQVVMTQGDGWLRSFDAMTGMLIWKCDLNPKGVKPGPFAHRYAVATPVFYNYCIYVGLGHEEETMFPKGDAHFYCIDATKEGDISPELNDGTGKFKPNPRSGVVWKFGGPVPAEAQKKGRKVLLRDVNGSCVVKDGLVYVPELNGYLHCLDAGNGKQYWIHDVMSSLPVQPLWVDGKIFVVDDSGFIWIFDHGKSKKEPIAIDMDINSRAAPVFANGILYIMTRNNLYAIREQK